MSVQNVLTRYADSGKSGFDPPIGTTLSPSALYSRKVVRGYGDRVNMGEQLMKNYYAKFKGICYAFSNKASRDTAVNDYSFEKLTANQALRGFGHTDSCSRFVVKCTVIPCSTPLELRNALSEVTE